ncbi:MAG: hypothetical protein ABEI31_08535 [Halodesulfurarchaeum sp.]
MFDTTIDIEGATTPLMVLSAILWLAVLVLGLAGFWFEGLLLSTFLLHPWFIIGASHRQQISVKLLVYPLAIWTVFRLGALVLAEYYSTLFGASAPSFLVTGFHPAFGAVYWLYWIGGFMTVVLAYGIFFRSEFLPEGEWDRFLEQVEAAKAGTAGDTETEVSG